MKIAIANGSQYFTELDATITLTFQFFQKVNMKIMLRFFCGLLLFSSLVACGNTTSKSKGILSEISGVWRAKGDGTMVSIIYADSKMRLLFGEDSIPVSLGEIDNNNKTANMNVILRTGKPGVWTIRQVWDKEKTSFHLQLTLHDGVQDELSFVRKISADDLNKIANAEARTQPGSIGNTAKAAEAATVNLPTAQAAPIQTTAVASGSATAVLATAQPVAVATSSPVAITWMPSFDCTKASTGAERLICSDKSLSEADVKLSQIYKAAANSASDKEGLKSAQSTWRKNERDACSDSQCMLAAYQSRIAQLSK